MDEKVKEIEEVLGISIEQLLDCYQVTSYEQKLHLTITLLLPLLSEKDKKIEELKEGARKWKEDRDVFFLQNSDLIRRMSTLTENLNQSEAKIKELDDINTKLSEALGNAIDDYHKIILRAEQAEIKIKSLEEGVAEIAEGKGRYDLDNHQHAINTIEDMKAIANKLLEKKVERI
jgi:uncharacterized phage infection (PIP) family protein YhgE